MTNPASRGVRVLLAVLVVASAVGGAAVVVAPVSAQESASTESADLDIVQPHYIDSSVDRSTDNGIAVYEASGQRLRLHPTNFDERNVIDTGISPASNASFSQANAGTGYILEPEQTGTYELYWVVERPASGPNASAGDTERVRYEATISVDGNLGVVAVPESRYNEQQEQAEKWGTLNSSVQTMIDNSWIVSTLPGDRPTAEAFIESALRKQRLVHNPAAAFGEGLTLLIFGIFSLGGGLLFLGALGWHAKAVAWLRRRLNIYESVEDAEGDVARKMEAQNIADAKRARQNQRFSDVYQPHIADAMAELGETPYEADINLAASMLPSEAVAQKARAMGASGYVAVVPEAIVDLLTGDDGADDEGDGASDVATDGGTDATEAAAADINIDTGTLLDHLEATDERLAIQPADVVDDDAVTVDLTEADRDWISVLPVNDEVLLEFDLAGAEYDRLDADGDLPDWDLEDIIERTHLEMRHFDSPAEAAEHLLAFVEDTCQHQVTDPDGRPRTTRTVLETVLRDSQILEDRFNLSRQHVIDWLEAAIRADDPVAEGLDHAADVEDGKYE